MVVARRAQGRGYPAAMVHLRIVVPSDLAPKVLDLLDAMTSVCNLVHPPGTPGGPPGDVILWGVGREDASIVIDDLKELGVSRRGSISLEQIDSQISDAAKAAERAARGLPSDAVVWEGGGERHSAAAARGRN